jgi:hypothetical protein
MSRTELSIYMVNILAIVILVLWIITVVRICRLWKTDKAAAKDMLGKLVFKTVIWTICIVVIIVLLLQSAAFVSSIAP